jgi:hypothetical protein
MLERRARGPLEFFICGSLRDLIPDDHVLVRVDRVLELDWLHDEVAELYADGVGRPAIEPEAAVRLMLAGFLLGIVHDRRLMREAQVNIAIRPSGPCDARVRPPGGRVRARPGTLCKGSPASA